MPDGHHPVTTPVWKLTSHLQTGRQLQLADLVWPACKQTGSGYCLPCYQHCKPGGHHCETRASLNHSFPCCRLKYRVSVVVMALLVLPGANPVYWCNPGNYRWQTSRRFQHVPLAECLCLMCAYSIVHVQLIQVSCSALVSDTISQKLAVVMNYSY